MLLLLFVPLSVSNAHSGHTPRLTADNAAYYYVAAATLLNATFETGNTNVKQIQTAIKEFQPLFDYKKVLFSEEIQKILRCGFAQAYCDWKVDYDQDELWYYDDVTKLYAFCLSASIQSSLDGDHRAACDYWRDAMTLCRHISHDKCLVTLLSSYRNQIQCLELGSKICENLGKNDLAYLEECWKKLPKTKEHSDVIVDEKGHLLHRMKKDPIMFFRTIKPENKVNVSGMMGFLVDKKAASDLEKQQSLKLLEQVEEPVIERLFQDITDQMKLPANEAKKRIDSLYAGVRRLDATDITKRILREAAPYCGNIPLRYEELVRERDIFSKKSPECTHCPLCPGRLS